MSNSPETPAGRFVRESKAEFSEYAMPNDANPLGTVFGGKVMALVDLAGSIAAARHAKRAVVTASVDYMTFLYPIKIGQLIVCYSSVNRVFRSSMEVGVKVAVENLHTGEIRHTCSAYLTFVALGEDGRPSPITPVIPESDEEKRRFEDALHRREMRLELKKRMQEGRY